MHLSGDIAFQSWPKIAKFCTFESPYWLNHVTTILDVPARILRIFFSAKPKPTAWVWWEKVYPPLPPQSKTIAGKILLVRLCLEQFCPTQNRENIWLQISANVPQNYFTFSVHGFQYPFKKLFEIELIKYWKCSKFLALWKIRNNLEHLKKKKFNSKANDFFSFSFFLCLKK